ncbi:hypothetical protein MKK70_09080 [Methylobacterium sp. E-041]|uniref:lipase/acyltransferase domain-containing protein n=1 Tax=Methylobacterium sp. E-041 TaxID=2836573 RepID=UPI001FB93F65|nr:hypothetical protein [Methylobacterium sp. E-041]MCJ2105530.1 hypothetical protein [Methylobacterium sp. E-041]
MAAGFSDVVVVLPGLIGSVLEKDGKQLWGVSPGGLWGIVAGNNLDQLKLASPDNGDDDLGDGIVATRLVPNVELIPGLWKQGGYGRMGTGLIDRLGLIPGENYFEFPYDWRRDNRVAARKLAEKAPGRLASWREKTGNPDAKIVLVAHSMGGLVGRYFVECLEGWKIVRSIISFGAPFRGSGNALGYLCNGFTWDVGGVPLFNGTDALRSFESVHQLLPVYPFVDVDGTKLERVADVTLPNLDRNRAIAAAAFHREIADAHTANANDPDYRAHGTKVWPIIGFGQPTWQSATLRTGLLMPSYRMPGENLTGDGTVSTVSAIPRDDDALGAMYLPTTHSALQSRAAGLDHFHGIMTQADVNQEKFRSAGGHIGLSVRDAYPSTDPVHVVAVPSDYRQTLGGRIERMDVPEAVKEITLYPKGDEFIVDVVLTPGLYRVTVEGDDLPAVEDVFLVVDPSEIS